MRAEAVLLSDATLRVQHATGYLFQNDPSGKRIRLDLDRRLFPSMADRQCLGAMTLSFRVQLLGLCLGLPMHRTRSAREDAGLVQSMRWRMRLRTVHKYRNSQPHQLVLWVRDAAR